MDIKKLIQDESGYIDAGTGSIFLQILIGALISAPILVKVFWSRIKNVFSRKK